MYFFHVQDIVVTSTQFSVLSNVVDSNHNGSADSGCRIGHQIKVGVYIDLVERGHLWNLAVSLSAQIYTHLLEDLREAQVVFRDMFVLIEDSQ
jgi:hypothetical protein